LVIVNDGTVTGLSVTAVKTVHAVLALLTQIPPRPEASVAVMVRLTRLLLVATAPPLMTTTPLVGGSISTRAVPMPVQPSPTLPATSTGQMR
jgi:hypothetical protein